LPDQEISPLSIARIRVPCVNEEEEDGKSTQYRDLENKFVKQKSNNEIILELQQN